MTKKEMVDMYVRSRSIDGKDYSGDKVEPIMPFIIGDLCYQTYLNATNGMELSHKMSQMDGYWREAYTRFNKPFFAVYPEETHCEITDLMDSLTSYIENDLMILLSQLMKVIDDVDFEEKKRMANFLMSHILTQYAQISWGNTYKVQVVQTHGAVYNKPHINANLGKMKNWSFKIAVEFFRPIAKGKIRLTEANVDGVFRLISKHIYEWIDEN